MNVGAGLLGEPPLERDVGVARVAVDQHDRRAEHRFETSAFHIIHAVVVNQSTRSPRLDVQAEPEVLAVLEQDAAVPVHDRLRQPGRAGGEEHVQRVGERDRVELERARARRAARPSRSCRAAHRRGRPRTGRGRRARATAVPRGPRPPARGGRRPCRRSGSRRSASSTFGSSCPNRSSTLRGPNSEAQVAQIAPRLAVARNATSVSGMFGRYATTRSPRPTPSRCSPARARADLLAQLAEGQLERIARLRAGEDRDRAQVLVAPHGVLGVVQLRAGEPPAPGIASRGQHPLVRCRAP